MGRNMFETAMGAVVITVALAFVVIAYKSGNIGGTQDGYIITAKFEDVGGITIGSDVKMSGIKIGTVIKQGLDSAYFAVLTLNIDDNIKLSDDSSAKIVSDGLLGGSYISITPGGSPEMLKNRGEIRITQSAVNLLDLIARKGFGSVEDESSSKKSDL